MANLTKQTIHVTGEKTSRLRAVLSAPNFPENVIPTDGTKEGAYQKWECGGVESLHFNQKEPDLEIHFISRNGDARPIIRTLADKFPDITFEVCFCDEFYEHFGAYEICRAEGFDNSDDYSEKNPEGIIRKCWGQEMADRYRENLKCEVFYQVDDFVIRGAYDDDGDLQIYLHQMQPDGFPQELDGHIQETESTEDFYHDFSCSMVHLDLPESVKIKFHEREAHVMTSDQYWDLVS